MLAILYIVAVADPLTSRTFYVTRPEIALIRADFPDLPPASIKVQNTGHIMDVSIEEIWNRALSDHARTTVTMYAGNDRDVVPPAFELAMQIAENEAIKLQGIIDNAPAFREAVTTPVADTAPADGVPPPPVPVPQKPAPRMRPTSAPIDPSSQPIPKYE